MKRLLHCLTRRGRGFFGFYLLAHTVNAQVGLPDSTVVPVSSTVFKIRPMALIWSVLDIAVEQTVGKRSSVQLGVYETVGNGRFARVLGKARSLSASFRYYPLANQTAPNGLYVGSGVSYGSLINSNLLRFITFAISTGDASLWSTEALVGYQLCSHRNLVLDVRGGLGFLHRLTYQRSDLASQPATEHLTKFGLLPSLTVSIGYRFRHRLNRTRNAAY